MDVLARHPAPTDHATERSQARRTFRGAERARPKTGPQSKKETPPEFDRVRRQSETALRWSLAFESMNTDQSSAIVLDPRRLRDPANAKLANPTIIRTHVAVSGIGVALPKVGLAVLSLVTSEVEVFHQSWELRAISVRFWVFEKLTTGMPPLNAPSTPLPKDWPQPCALQEGRWKSPTFSCTSYR